MECGVSWQVAGINELILHAIALRPRVKAKLPAKKRGLKRPEFNSLSRNRQFAFNYGKLVSHLLVLLGGIEGNSYNLENLLIYS